MKNWTIILQMSAENNLYLDMVECFNTIGTYEVSDKINFLILFDGPKDDREQNPEKGFPCIYEMAKGMSYSRAVPVKNYGNEFEDLSNIANLSTILKEIKKLYPASQYGYIYSGHGGAGEGDISNGVFKTKIDRILPQERDENGDVIEELLEKRLTIRFWNYEGYCELTDPSKKDIILVVYSQKTNNYLTYKGMNKVLENVFSGKELSFVFLDTCWGMMMENCYTFKDITGYYVATADEMPSSGVGYGSLINLLNQWPQIKSEELAKLLVAVNYSNNYADYAKGRKEFENMGVSLSCTDVGKLEDIISDYFDPLCDYLITKMKSLYLVFKKAAEQCNDYTYVDYSKPDAEDYGVYNIDLIWFLENIMHFNTKEKKVIDVQLQLLASGLLQQISLYLIKGYMSNNYEEAALGETPIIGGKGIAITLPKNSEQLANADMYQKGLSNFVVNTKWKTLIKTYLKTVESTYNILKNDDLESFDLEWTSIKNNEFTGLYFDDISNKSRENFLSEYKSFLDNAQMLHLSQKWSTLRRPHN